MKLYCNGLDLADSFAKVTNKILKFIITYLVINYNYFSFSSLPILDFKKVYIKQTFIISDF